jgi:hypothetical protein
MEEMALNRNPWRSIVNVKSKKSKAIPVTGREGP